MNHICATETLVATFPLGLQISRVFFNGQRTEQVWAIVWQWQNVVTNWVCISVIFRYHYYYHTHLCLILAIVSVIKICSCLGGTLCVCVRARVCIHMYTDACICMYARHIYAYVYKSVYQCRCDMRYKQHVNLQIWMAVDTSGVMTDRPNEWLIDIYLGIP